MELQLERVESPSGEAAAVRNGHGAAVAGDAGMPGANLEVTQEALKYYAEQVRRIRMAACNADLRGLHCACALLERNAMLLQKERRLLQDAEYTLLLEVPQLLALYAQEQCMNRAAALLEHLQHSAWPVPLTREQAVQLRQLLALDCKSQACGAGRAGADTGVEDIAAVCIECGSAAVMALQPGASLCECVHEAQPQQVPSSVPVQDGEAQAALHDALDALIVSIGDANSFGAEHLHDAQDLADYAARLHALSACAAKAGVAVLAKACDKFADVVIQRAAKKSDVTEAELGLLNLFPILSMDSLADPENQAAGSALLDLACDPIWDQIHAVAAAKLDGGDTEAHDAATCQHCLPLDQAGLAVAAGFDTEAGQGQGSALEEEEVVGDGLSRVAQPVHAQPAVLMQQISGQMLALLDKEIGLMQEALQADLDSVLQAQGGPALAEALCNYREALARIGMTAGSVGLQALQGVFEELLQLLNWCEHGFNAQQQAVLEQLLPVVRTWLEAPTDFDAAMGVVMVLLDPCWQPGFEALPAEEWMQALTRIEFLPDSEEDESARPSVASEEDVSLALPPDLNQQLLDGLLQELPIQLDSFTSAIGRVAAGRGTRADLEQAKRAAHTLKGAANTVGIAGIANLTHHLEDILINLTEQGAMPGPGLARLLVEAGDCLEAMGDAVMGEDIPPPQAKHILQRVLDYANGEEDDASMPGQDLSPALPPMLPPSVAQVAVPGPMQAALSPSSIPAQATGLEGQLVHGLPLGQIAATAGAEQPATGAQGEGDGQDGAQMMRVPAPLVDELLRLAGENIISNSQMQESLQQAQKQAKALMRQDALLQKLIADLEHLVDVRGLGVLGRAASSAHGEFDPLEFERYSELHTVTSQLIEAATDARQMSGQMTEQLHAVDELLQMQRRLHMENQKAVIRTRLVPVSSVVSRLQRCVRQACRLLGKSVELQVIGENTSIDSNMLHDLLDPLMHVLRNAVDHGIESEALRIAAGKAVTGQIRLQFANEGNSVLVRCSDDGAGLDYAAILRSAQRKNLLPPDKQCSDDELARLILLPGFSTRDNTTLLSGRGIGMDAVYSKILQMKGSLSLHSNSGQGMTVELRLPASLLSEHTLMARVAGGNGAGKLLAISSRRVLDLHYVTPDQIEVLGNEHLYRVGDSLHKVRRLESMLGLPLPVDAKKGCPALLVAMDNGDTCAVLVAELVDGREAVVKKLGRYVARINGTIGAVILGDGSVAPVLDLAELLRAEHRHISSYADGSLHVSGEAQEAGGYPGMKSALVVDDSLSARRAAAQLMRDAGYQVRTAIDGMDAVAMLEQQVPDVMLVDMEMPRMNGLELTAHVRARERTRHVPVIMITSRSTEKHRQQGDAAGVNAYLLKPFNDDQLLAEVERLVGIHPQQ